MAHHGIDELLAAGTALAASPEVAFAAGVTGASNLFAGVSTPDTSALWQFLTSFVGRLPGVRDVETVTALRPVKGAVAFFPRPPTRASRHASPRAGSPRGPAATVTRCFNRSSRTAGGS
ncbi:Lrp/AsnC ligand binding domain-containing protein [Streptomyces broussonetiae]|uniref:Lrp/AsnC ligand binding domain-containing protein n=1 Tax=Streptomyces broussonetiae TaxID=2686304 RepID=UPI003899F86E